jgi:hypothetical protein
MFVLTRPALTVISHSCVPYGSKRAKLERLASDSLDWLSRWQNYKKNGRKNSFLIKIFEKIALLKKMYYICSQSYEDSRIYCPELTITEPVGIP